MKLFKDLFLPVLVGVINVALGAHTGLFIFHVMGAIILTLCLFKLWNTRRSGAGKE